MIFVGEKSLLIAVSQLFPVRKKKPARKNGPALRETQMTICTAVQCD